MAHSRPPQTTPEQVKRICKCNRTVEARGSIPLTSTIKPQVKGPAVEMLRGLYRFR